MKAYYLDKAKLYEPKIYKSVIEATRYGEPVPDDTQWFKYQFLEKPPITDVKEGDSFCIDFGNHYTGYLSFYMNQLDFYPDAPVKLQIKLAESIYELATDFDAYKGELSASWLQEEIIHIDEPGPVTLPRRYAFRYIQVKVLAMGVGYSVKLSDFKITAVTSADVSKCKVDTLDPELRRIDEVGCRTLANCMQRIFEDGPKRDRRLWIGDLRLQALTAYHVFGSVDVAKRCMYLFAGYTNSQGRVPRDIFQGSKTTHCDGEWLLDYALMFPVCLCDYFTYTGDEELVNDLFSIADNQLRLAWRDTRDDIVMDPVKEILKQENWWAHIDWSEGLNKVTSVQGVLLYALHKMIDLCQKTGRLEYVEEYQEQVKRLTNAALEKLYDNNLEYFINDYDKRQLSVHSQIWMILGDVVVGEQAERLLLRVLQDKNAKQAGSPYMHHYVLEAFFKLGLKEEAFSYMKSYWGEMVRCGADTYWEMFVPGDFSVTPYGDPVMNSCCHAWSCSVSYFIRKYWR